MTSSATRCATAIGASLVGLFAVGACCCGDGPVRRLAGSVTRRRHELAVRLAVGANHQVLRIVVGEGTLLVGVGVLLGVPGIYAASGLIRGALVGVSPSDVGTLGVVACLALVTLATGYVAARRALGIDPAQLLREE